MQKREQPPDCEMRFTGQVTPEQICRSIQYHLKFDRCKNWASATDFDKYLSLAMTIRDMAVERMITTQGAYLDHDVKRVYYLSLEFLMGRLLSNNMIAMQAYDATRLALKKLNLDLETLCRSESDAGLGNGGLGRLAACFLDSMATMELPAYGYGLRYEHGMFRQELENGWQRERPDDWLKYGYPWEMIRPEYTIPVLVYGHVENLRGHRGETTPVWVDWQMFEGLPYDIPIIGYANNTVNFLRLWSSRSNEGFRLDVFNQGDYVKAVQQENWAEIVTKVLYPSDNTSVGRELRLIQEYFLVSCSIRDIMRRFQKNNKDWNDFPKKNAVQMNDTHPSLAVVELMRYFRDEINLPWDKAWDLTVRTLGYTNHTIMSEALEKWPVPLMEKVLPRHLQLIYEINKRFLQKVEIRYPGDAGRLQRMSLIEESNPKQVRMAQLAIVGSHSVNGVSALHSRLLTQQVFPEFAELWPGKFNNKTNGITQRRWLLVCNPDLAALITRTIGDAWIKDLDQMKRLEAFAENPEFQEHFMAVKHQNKVRLARLIRKVTGETVNPHSLFDVHIKRLHEYKRQLLNALHILTLYYRIKANPALPMTPRTFIFGAKAAPSYTVAKHIIKLITSIGDRIHSDPDVDGRLKVIFLPDYEVSLAEIIVPAADLSEQISTAGTEASGTGNMKLALNGALTIGTWDGATIEIAEAVGLDNIFIFGHRTEELLKMRKTYNPRAYLEADPELQQVVNAIRDNQISPDDPALFSNLYKSLVDYGDHYFHLADYRPYVECQQKVCATFADKSAWARKVILNVARMGRFSSDRTIREYANDIWQIKPLPINLEAPVH
ncbi:MAG: glycogen/starch/alpha-glucan phosphorylase [Kiritimatiellae bacterium]|nr:glycogen/starch/alpha-glucan phosphorylase [Kiritimatiellia bacterium]